MLNKKRKFIHFLKGLNNINERKKQPMIFLIVKPALKIYLYELLKLAF